MSKPFSHSIVDAINGINFKEDIINDRANASRRLGCLMDLLCETFITSNHADIAKAVRTKASEVLAPERQVAWTLQHIRDQGVRGHQHHVMMGSELD